MCRAMGATRVKLDTQLRANSFKALERGLEKAPKRSLSRTCTFPNTTTQALDEQVSNMSKLCTEWPFGELVGSK